VWPTTAADGNDVKQGVVMESYWQTEKCCDVIANLQQNHKTGTVVGKVADR